MDACAIMANLVRMSLCLSELCSSWLILNLDVFKDYSMSACLCFIICSQWLFSAPRTPKWLWWSPGMPPYPTLTWRAFLSSKNIHSAILSAPLQLLPSTSSLSLPAALLWWYGLRLIWLFHLILIYFCQIVLTTVMLPTYCRRNLVL